METLSRNWSWVVLRGIVAILFGVLTLFLPGISLAALVLLFGAYVLTDGVFTIAWAIANHRDEPRWPALILSGVLGIAAGVLTLFRPDITGTALLLVIAVWGIAGGLATVVAAFKLRREISGEWRLVLAGLLAMTMGVILLAAPGVGALAMVLWIGMYAIGAGVLLIALGFQLKSWGRRTHHAELASHPA